VDGPRCELPPSVDRDTLLSLRHHLHATAELSDHEAATASCMKEFLVACRPDRVIDGLGGHGLAAVFGDERSGAPGDPVPAGPTVIFRAELDALPVGETGTCAYRSRSAGISHACGHDGHLAILAGLGLWLADNPPQHGRVVLLCQPAEETGTGARRIVDDTRYQALAPDWIFAVHNLPGYPLGRVLVRPGPVAAGSVGMRIHLRGRTSHAAYPEQGASPALAMSELITRLVGLPIPLERHDRLALVTIVHARLGAATFGTTPGDARIGATLRSDNDATLAELQQQAERAARQIAAEHALGCDVEWIEAFPVTRNHPEAVRLVDLAAGRLGLHTTTGDESPFRWSEDFGWFTRDENDVAPVENVPAGGPPTRGALFCLGAGRKHPPLHAADYDFPDALLELGVCLYVQLAISASCPAPPR